MKRRNVVVLLLIAAAIVAFLLRPWAGPKPTGVQNTKTSTAESRPPPAPQPGAAPENGTDDSLTRAGKMAAFINEYIDSLPPDRAGIVPHLRGLQAIFFASDYIMAAKTNSSLTLSKSAILAAFAKVSTNTSELDSRLPTWAWRPYGLTEHYRNISGVPEAKESIKAIKAAMTDNGIPVDTESELLMDCIRYAGYNTGLQEAYGPNPREGEPMPNPAALKAFSECADAVFQHRFVEFYGLNPSAVSNLMNQTKDVRVYGLSQADSEIPVVQFQ
jgi:hypothetical protein